VYEAAASTSLATSLSCTRTAAAAGGNGSSRQGSTGGSSDGSSLQISVQCTRLVITSDLPEDAEAAAIVEVP
jgi:hypothetical protein